MTEKRNEVHLGKAGLSFLLITIGIFSLSLLIALLIIQFNGSFTYWAVVPPLAGFPATILINITIAKKAIAKYQTKSLAGESQDEQVE